jgi:hypothetical protein
LQFAIFKGVLLALGGQLGVFDIALVAVKNGSGRLISKPYKIAGIAAVLVVSASNGNIGHGHCFLQGQVVVCLV